MPTARHLQFQTRLEAKDEISEMAMAIAEKVVGRELKVEDHINLFDEFIKELGEGV